MDVPRWLRALGLERYESAFARHGITAGTLPRVTADTLIAMGVTSVGHRRRLLDAIARLHGGVAPAPPESAAAESVEHAERRRLTVLLCDMVGSTNLSVQLDPEDLRGVIRAYHAACTRWVHRYDGYIANFIGDGMLVYFGWPRAHEDDIDRAVRVGLALARSMRDLSTPLGEGLEVRVGIATGMVIVGDLVRAGPAQEQSAIGATPNLAARMQALAEPGQVVVDAQTRRLLSAAFEARPLAQGEAFCIDAERAAASRFGARALEDLTPLLGRSDELAQLQAHWEEARAGHGQFVLLTGDPGVGKSRLVHALSGQLRSQPRLRLRYQCSPDYTDSALWPVMQQLRFAAGIVEADEPAIAVEKLHKLFGPTAVARSLAAALLRLGDGAAEDAAVSLPAQRRERIVRGLIVLLARLARRQPVMAVLEDVHWIDPTTHELLLRCMTRLRASALMILMTSRPGVEPAVAKDERVRRLHVGPLAPAQIRTLVDRLARQRLTPAVVQRIAVLADGVPLFAEELSKAALEADGASVPASLQGSLLAQLDRIPDVKPLAQVAACIGREFGLALLGAVAGQPNQTVAQSIARIRDAGLLVQRECATDTHAFRHALVQQAIYESLLRSKREHVHSRIYDALSAQLPIGSPELRARHAQRAERHAEAIACWEEAGDASLAESAYHEAGHHFERALELIARRGRDAGTRDLELRLLCKLSHAQAATHGYGASATLQTLEHAHRLLAESHDMAVRLPVLLGLSRSLLTRGECSRALSLASELLDAARRASDRSAEHAALRMVGSAEFTMAELEAARVHMRQAIALEPEDLVDASALTLEVALGVRSRLARVELLLGDLPASRAAQRDGRALGAKTRSRHEEALICHFETLLHLLARDERAALQTASQLMLLARRHHFRLWAAMAHLNLACVAVEQKRHAEAVEIFAVGFTRLGEGDDVRSIVSFYRSAQALALARCDRASEARELIDRVIAEQAECRWAEPELWRVSGELWLAQTRRAAARAQDCFERALELARAGGARAWELRAALSLARLWLVQGRQAAVDSLLSPLCQVLAGRFETADLRDARGLLERSRIHPREATGSSRG